MIKVIEFDLGGKLEQTRRQGEAESAREYDCIHACFSGSPAVAMIEALIQHGVT
jgi:hypothetical protein